MDTPRPISLIDIIETMSDGDTKRDLLNNINAASAGAIATGKAASVTWKIEIKPIAGNKQKVAITDKITASIPDPAREATVLFVTENGLSADDPTSNLFNQRSNA